MKPALLIMAKAPIAGQTKTRLCPPLMPKQATALYRCFLEDTINLVSRVSGVQPMIAYHPPDAALYFQQMAPPEFQFVSQAGANLGERLDNVLSQCLSRGHRQAIAIDSDSPNLPVAYLEQAVQELDRPDLDAVFGPCEDGGYYLIGLKAPQPSLLRGVAMSTSTVLQDTLALAREAGLAVKLLPSWRDVDTGEDLQRLAAELRNGHMHVAPPHPRMARAAGTVVSGERERR